MTMEAGVTTLIRTRLINQFKELSTIETYASLIFDEMAIKPMSVHLKNKGRAYGDVNYGSYKYLVKQKRGVLANRLLCFVMKGISTNFRIPVAYFFVRQIKAETLVVIIKNLLRELEEIGFRIIRLVGDDYSVNQRAFKLLSRGETALPDGIT